MDDKNYSIDDIIKTTDRITLSPMPLGLKESVSIYLSIDDALQSKFIDELFLGELLKFT